MPDSLTGPLVSPALADAFAYALKLHPTQVRKQAEGERRADGIPYISHLMMVAALVLEHGGSETEAIAALLHDGPEDAGGRETLREIRKRFGEDVAGIVETCTDTFEEEKPDWWPRKCAYHDALRQASNSAILVSLADKTHNLEATRLDVKHLGDEFWDRFTQGRQRLAVVLRDTCRDLSRESDERDHAAGGAPGRPARGRARCLVRGGREGGCARVRPQDVQGE